MKIKLTDREFEIWCQVQAEIDKTALWLSTLTRDERLDYLREHQYPHPVSFERETGGTVYTVNAHFNNCSAESIEEKTKRILARKTSL